MSIRALLAAAVFIAAGAGYAQSLAQPDQASVTVAIPAGRAADVLGAPTTGAAPVQAPSAGGSSALVLGHAAFHRAPSKPVPVALLPALMMLPPVTQSTPAPAAPAPTVLKLAGVFPFLMLLPPVSQENPTRYVALVPRVPAKRIVRVRPPVRKTAFHWIVPPLPHYRLAPLPAPGSLVSPLPAPGSLVSPLPRPGSMVQPLQAMQTAPVPQPGSMVQGVPGYGSQGGPQGGYGR